MPPDTFHHRFPRAGVDPINRPDLALMAIAMALHRPLRHETIVLLLDSERRGLAVVVVSGTDQPDQVLDVVECVADPAAHGGESAAAVVASVRPGSAEIPGDVDRWLEMSDLADRAGVELVEWFVVGTDITCPRDALAEPPRW